MKSFLVCALEPSANAHLRSILREYQKNYGRLELCGIYDEALAIEFGLAAPLFSSRDFGVMGFSSILPLILRVKGAIRSLVDLALEKRFDAVLCIDSSSFNLRFAKALRRAEKRVGKKGAATRRNFLIYYILPQVWAWKRWRARLVERDFDLLASIWPFEKTFYPSANFLGHPLLDEIPPAQPPRPLKKIQKIALLPGSRRGEIARLMPIFRELAGYFGEGVEKILCLPEFYFRGGAEEVREIYGDVGGLTLATGTADVLARADFAFICSGTATLEATLALCPFILAYRAGAVDFYLAKSLVKLAHVGLANIICDLAGHPPMHPELLQGRASAAGLYAAFEAYDFEGFYAGASFVREYLSGAEDGGTYGGAARRMAKILSQI